MGYVNYKGHFNTIIMFTVQLAGVNIFINTIYSKTETVFVDFITNEQYDYCIDVTAQRINAERHLLHNAYPQKEFKDYEIEINALYRDIPKILIKENVILLHGVLICIEQRGYIFTAPSGTGKSTHVGLCKKVFGDKVKIINGDKPLLKLSEKGVFAYGSPWKGKEKIGSNESVKLSGICYLQRGNQNSIEQVEFNAKSLTWLLEQSQIKGLEYSITDRLRWFKSAAKYVTLYNLKCNISDESAKVAYYGMNGQFEKKREIVNSIEDVLNNCGTVTYKVFGKSMEPMISPNRDIVTIQRKTNNVELHENDVVLYRQKGKLILHRIVEVVPGGEYIILGDNCSRKEYGIYEDDIIGVLTSFKHNGIHYDIKDSKYTDYVNRLRASENVRTKRKLIYDILVQHLQFLPTSLYFKLKTILKKLIVYQISFV